MSRLSALDAQFLNGEPGGGPAISRATIVGTPTITEWAPDLGKYARTQVASGAPADLGSLGSVEHARRVPSIENSGVSAGTGLKVPQGGGL